MKNVSWLSEYYVDVIWIIFHYLNSFAVYFFSLDINANLLDVAGCDITLNVTDTKQYVATEGYSHNYKNNQDCNFNFVAPSGRIFIVLFEDFHLEEPGPLSFFVDYDYLHFRKLHNTNSHAISQIMVS